MKKNILLIIINLLLLSNSYATNRQDSIYNDLYQFLILKQNMPKEMYWILECDSCEQYLYIFNILKDEFPNTPDFINIPFGIYKFQYVGCMDCSFYVLIKYNENYTVYPPTAATLIIKELLKIRKENPELIDNELYEAYIEAIVDDRTGMYPAENKGIIHTIGRVDFIVSH